MTAFFSWYSIPPLISYIAKDLGISASQVYDSNVVAVTATIGKLSSTSQLFMRVGLMAMYSCSLRRWPVL